MLNKFIDYLLPGNYALTKSMELTKVQSSGTLWYTKKFLTLYYFIFLTNDIYTKQYINEIIKSFDSFILSLPDSQRQLATDFFYSTDECLDFRSEKFKTFSSFTDFSSFSDEREKREYDRIARKYYFALLMGVGGQTGVKKKLKEKIQESSFVLTKQNIENCIYESAISICVEQMNASGKIDDNSIKYLISSEALEVINDLYNKNGNIDESDVRDAVAKHPHQSPGVQGIKNDMIAFIRNERQILFYYGFVHSKSSGANDVEFSSLTPVGHASIKANFYEFLSIWEHQKIKMISQPITCEILYVPDLGKDLEKFGISYSPYLDILSTLYRRNSLSVQEYMYIVSRKKQIFDEGEWASGENDLFLNIDKIENKIISFGRNRDIKEEDGRKELLKYILGIRNDLGIDNGTNPISFCEFKNGSITITNASRFCSILNVYKKLNDYKITRYSELFSDCDKGLREKYIASSKQQNAEPNPKTKIRWDLYNIHQDKLISMSLVFLISSSALNYDLLSLRSKKFNDVVSFSLVNFKDMLKSFGIKSIGKAKAMLQDVIFALNNNNYSKFIDEVEEKELITTYKKESAEDLLNKIKKVSSEYFEDSGSRQRNTNLISLLKSYYMARFMENGVLKCECCGEETFVTEAGDPYVEFHHLIPFNIALGPDHYLNLFALCPNCHRKMHYLKLSSKDEIYQNIDKNNYFKISIVDRLMELKADKILCSYHLEFLLAENAISQAQYNSIAL